MTDPASKIVKRDGEITDLEYQVARTLSELELSNTDLKQDIRDIFITGATNFRDTGSGSKNEALIIMILYRSMSATRRVHSQLV